MPILLSESEVNLQTMPLIVVRAAVDGDAVEIAAAVGDQWREKTAVRRVWAGTPFTAVSTAAQSVLHSYIGGAVLSLYPCGRPLIGPSSSAARMEKGEPCAYWNPQRGWRAAHIHG
jgi:hypothetical protein